MIENLDVMLWGKKVGTLVASRENHKSKACFYFDREYVSGGYDIAPLRASISGLLHSMVCLSIRKRKEFSAVCHRS